jgi:Zn-dependent protease
MVVIPIIILNVSLGIFNLIPVHPLDGGKILIGILPAEQAREADLFLRRFGMLILFLLIFPSAGGVSPVSALISPVISLLLRLLIPSMAI